MNNSLSTPFDPKQIVTTIVRWPDYKINIIKLFLSFFYY